MHGENKHRLSCLLNVKRDCSSCFCFFLQRNEGSSTPLRVRPKPRGDARRSRIHKIRCMGGPPNHALEIHRTDRVVLCLLFLLGLGAACVPILTGTLQQSRYGNRPQFHSLQQPFFPIQKQYGTCKTWMTPVAGPFCIFLRRRCKSTSFACAKSTIESIAMFSHLGPLGPGEKFFGGTAEDLFKRVGSHCPHLLSLRLGFGT